MDMRRKIHTTIDSKTDDWIRKYADDNFDGRINCVIEFLVADYLKRKHQAKSDILDAIIEKVFAEYSIEFRKREADD